MTVSLDEPAAGGRRLARRLLPPPRLPGSARSVRMRLTAIYGLLFLLCGAGLLAITYLLVEGAPFAPPLGYSPPAVSGNVPVGEAVERHAVLHQLLERSGIALAIMALVSVWLGWIVAGRVLAPLRTITARTRSISETNLHERLALSGPDDEVKELSDTIDGLLERLERAFELQKRFVANVSHELRTPLAMMRTSLDVADGKPRPISPDAARLSGKVREGLDQADRLVDSFLALARAEAGRIGARETVSLAELAQAALADRADALSPHGADALLPDGADAAATPRVTARCDDAWVPGSRTLLARLVANLLDNAERYNRPGGAITIATTTEGSMARLVVENDGAVLDPGQAGQLLEPFRRQGTYRTGSENGLGLGLAIVGAIATAHDGTVHVRARPEGGLAVTVELPRAASAADPEPRRARAADPEPPRARTADRTPPRR